MSRRMLGVGFVLVCLLIPAGCNTNVSVPDVGRMTELVATGTLVTAQLVVGTVTDAPSATVPVGCVISQDPTAGASVAKGASVNLVVSTGRQPLVAWSYVPSSNSIWGLTVDKTLDGGFIIGGGHNNWYDMYALHLNETGGRVWDKWYSNPAPDVSHAELWRHEADGARQTADGGYILLSSGNLYQDEMPSPSYLLVKTGATGEVAWSKTYAPDNPYDPGHLCVGNKPGALQVTGDGGYVAFGSSYVGTYSLASMLKTDAAGNLDFVKVINDNAKAYDEYIVGGQQTQDGGYVLAGYSENGSPLGYLALLMKVDEDGNLEWSKTYQYPPDNHGAQGYCVTQTSDGGYVLGGLLVNDIGKSSSHGFWMTKVDDNGDQVWAHSYLNEDIIQYANAVCETPQGDILAAGGSHIGEMTLAKFTSAGTFLWDFKDADLPHATANGLVLTDDGGCVMVGSGNTGGPTLVMKVNDVFAVD